MHDSGVKKRRALGDESEEDIQAQIEELRRCDEQCIFVHFKTRMTEEVITKMTEVILSFKNTDFRRNPETLEVAALRALEVIRENEKESGRVLLHPIREDQRQHLNMWIMQEEPPPEWEARLIAFLSQMSQEEAELLANHPPERKRLIKEGLKVVSRQAETELFEKLGAREWPDGQIEAWVTRYICQEFPSLALKPDQEVDAAVFLGLQVENSFRGCWVWVNDFVLDGRIGGVKVGARSF